MIGRLITLIHKPYTYQVKPGAGPGGTGLLMVDGEQFDLQRFYHYPDIDLRLMPPVELSVRNFGGRKSDIEPEAGGRNVFDCKRVENRRGR